MIALIFVAQLFFQCDVSIGAIRSCSATTFTGTAVVGVDGRYRPCKIANGRVYECAGWFSGKTPAFGPDGRWHMCRVSTGRVMSCDGVGYTGTLVTTKPTR